MSKKITHRQGAGPACACGAKTPAEHLAAILAGHKVHTWSGPKPRTNR